MYAIRSYYVRASSARVRETKTTMWVIKIGGHLAEDPVLTEWLERIADLGGGRVVLVPGGGDFV